MKKNLKIVFLGNPEFALPSLEALVKENYQIIGVITSPDKPVGRKRVITPPPVKVLAQKHRLAVYQPKNKSELLEIIKKLQPDVAIVAAFGMIFEKEVLDIPKYGFINIHPSILPKYRGATPIQSAILNADEETGVSLFLIEKDVDSGSVFAISRLPLWVSDSYEILMPKLAKAGAELLIEILPKYLSGEIKPLPQNKEKATYTKKFSSQDGYVEPVDLEKAENEGNQIALDIYRKILALNPEPGVFTLSQSKGGPKRIKLLEAKLTAENKLKLTKIQVEGKKPISL